MMLPPLKSNYPVPPSVEDRDPASNETSMGFDPEVEAILRSQGAFITPPQEVSDELVSTFFRCVHPAWPVLDRSAFSKSYHSPTVSFLVLQTIYCLTVPVCDEQLLKRTGFNTRYEARRTYYRRAKALYDADYEKDKSQLAAVLLLLSFWWEKPQDQKDTWHWLGCAISLGTNLGYAQVYRTLWLKPAFSFIMGKRNILVNIRSRATCLLPL